jgi:hypothetical protein
VIEDPATLSAAQLTTLLAIIAALAGAYYQ